MLTTAWTVPRGGMLTLLRYPCATCACRVAVGQCIQAPEPHLVGAATPGRRLARCARLAAAAAAGDVEGPAGARL
jgi:hypothetical protein